MIMMKAYYTTLRALVYIAVLTLAVLWNQNAAAALLTPDRSAAVVFVYQRVGDDNQPNSSISLDQFKTHIVELKNGGYNVMALPDIIAAIKAGTTLPRKTVAITFDGAYTGTLNNIAPVLEDAGYPYTVFYTSDDVDDNLAGYADWPALKKLYRNKNVTLGVLPATYAHMTSMAAADATASINKAVGRYKDQFGTDPSYFAWPYGEYSNALRKQISTYKFAAVFGQQSGVVHAGSDFAALPRFTMTDLYGDSDRFRLTANALPLPVSDVTPEDTLLKQNPPMIGFTLPSELQDLSKLSCFISGMGKIGIHHLPHNRIEIRPEEPFYEGRTRINCTLPDDTVIPGEAPGWRWLGFQFISGTPADDSMPVENSGLE